MRSDDTQGRGTVTTRKSVDGLVEQRGIRVPEQPPPGSVADLGRRSRRPSLIEHRQGCSAPSRRPHA